MRIVADIFRMASENLGPNAIQNRLCKLGIKAPLGGQTYGRARGQARGARARKGAGASRALEPLRTEPQVEELVREKEAVLALRSEVVVVVSMSLAQTRSTRSTSCSSWR